MKRFAAIILASSILFLNIGLSISKHYCDGEFISTALTFGNQELGCKMNLPTKDILDAKDKLPNTCDMENMDSCHKEQKQVNETFHNNCCENEYLSLKIDDNYEKQSLKDINVDFKFVAAYIISYIDLFSVNNLKSKAHFTYAPPLLLQDVQILHQSFLL